MKPTKTLTALTAALLLGSAPSLAEVKEHISARNVETFLTDRFLIVTADLVLDSLEVRTNRQVVITPLVIPAQDTLPTAQYRDTLPSVLVNGRNMHISYERGVLRGFPALKDLDIVQELRRLNGTKQTVEYVAKVPLQPWMTEKGTHVTFRYDACGCGVGTSPEFYDTPVTYVSIVDEPITDEVFRIPEVNIPVVTAHEGKARIQFEVDRTALHVEPYICRNGQLLDNRAEIKVIDDSVKYALSDPNVELVGIDICGYASPESPYLHNVELADGRCAILAEYLADRYRLPRGSVTYSSVPENWGEFREMVVGSDEIDDRHRQLLLELIDAPASTPEEYDRKETLLKTDPRYAPLYRNLILPEWFPKLRATTFVLKTQLKDLDLEELKKVFRTSPGLMSLQQLCVVADDYARDSDEFNEVVLTALAKYPKEQIAMVNAAIGAMARGEYDRARGILRDAEQTADVFDMLALMSQAEHDYDGAARYYGLAGNTEMADEMRRKADRLKEILEKE